MLSQLKLNPALPKVKLYLQHANYKLLTKNQVFILYIHAEPD